MDPRVLFFGQVLLAPVLIGIVTALARQGPRRTVLALAAVSMAVLACGVIYYDVVTGLRSEIGYLTTSREAFSQGINTLFGAYLVIAAGLALAAAAAVVALSRTAQLGRWGWFAAILLMTIFASAVVYGLDNGFPSSLFGADLQLRLNRGDATVSTPFYIAVSVLLVLAPLASLLYGWLGPDAPKPAPLA